jgi:hypothetical protein
MFTKVFPLLLQEMLVRVQPDGIGVSVKVAKLKGTVLHCPPLRLNGVCAVEPTDQLNVNAVVLAGFVTLQMVRVWPTPADAPPPPQRVVPKTIATTNVANRNAQETVVRTVTLSSSLAGGIRLTDG